MCGIEKREKMQKARHLEKEKSIGWTSTSDGFTEAIIPTSSFREFKVAYRLNKMGTY